MVVAKSEALAAHLGGEALGDRHKENVMAIVPKAAGG
jgi:hypothetical protein